MLKFFSKSKNQENDTIQDDVTELYHKFGKKLYSYAIHKWNVDEDEAWELIYKTLYKVIANKKKYTFESEEKFAAFIFKIFINYLRNHYRDKKTKTNDITLTELTGNEYEKEQNSNYTEQTFGNEKMKILMEELEKMEDWQRILLLMRSDGRSYSEIANFIEKPENQLKVYYQRLKERITKKVYERV